MSMPLKPDLPAGSAQYAMNLEVTNFSAERLVMGQKVEAAALRVRADNQGYVLRGDVKINGIPALLEYRKARDQSEAEVRVAATLDEAGARAARLRSRRICQRPGADQDQRPRSARRRRQPLFGRGRPDAGAHRQAAARLGQAGRTAGAHVLHHDQPAAVRCGSTIWRSKGRALLVKGTVECDGVRRHPGREPAELQSLRRRQGDAAGRARTRRRAARHGARRRL